MGKWRENKIQNLAHVVMGQSPDGDTVNDGERGIPFLQGNADFGDEHPNEMYWCDNPKKLAALGDILLSVRAPVGEVNIADKQYCIGRGLAAISFSEINNSFAVYKISSIINQLHRKSQGTTFLAISKSDIDNIIIIYPKDDQEQSKIAEILRTIDTVIEKTKAIIEKYQRIKTGMIQDLLTNGIDEKGNIRSQKTHKYKDSPIGKIPVEWEENTFDKIAKNITTKTKVITDCINMESIESGTGALLSLNDSDIKSNKTVFKKGDVLFGKLRPYLRKYWHAIFDGTCSSEIMVFRPDNRITSLYLYYLVSSEKFVLFNDSQTFGTRMPRTGWPIIKVYQTSIPEINEQNRIIEKLSSIDTKIQSEQAYLEKLRRIKQGLMRDLLTHKIAVDTLLQKEAIR
jgi:type I restriction enzyme S subunit